jgi:hypothetical protein
VGGGLVRILMVLAKIDVSEYLGQPRIAAKKVEMMYKEPKYSVNF